MSSFFEKTCTWLTLAPGDGMILGRGGGGGRPLVLVRCSGPGVYGGGCSFEPSYSFVLRSFFFQDCINKVPTFSGKGGAESEVWVCRIIVASRWVVIAGMFHIIFRRVFIYGYLYAGYTAPR